jgi:hypothetical protein
MGGEGLRGWEESGRRVGVECERGGDGWRGLEGGGEGWRGLERDRAGWREVESGGDRWRGMERDGERLERDVEG